MEYSSHIRERITVFLSETFRHKDIKCARAYREFYSSGWRCTPNGWVRQEPSIARAILATPGLCAIDFETYPTDPAWHGEQAAAEAPRGQKAAAREVAELAAKLTGRAHRRVPCVLALAHEDGGEAVVRVDPAALPALFTGRRCSLVAHNAQFETECLLAHGVAADVDCTLLAAKCLYLTAVDEERPQPVAFGLADLVQRELGRTRDKSIRDRDWRDPAALDEEARAYARQDARDALALWQLYERRLRDEGLWAGYELIARAILPTAAINLAGMLFDAGAHGPLVATLRAEAECLEGELTALCAGGVANHASPAQVGDWIQEVLGDDDPGERIARFCACLWARCGVGWKRGKTGRLAITKSTKAKKAEALAGEFPTVANYLITHARWTHHAKLLGTFGESLAQWVDADGRLRGQLKVGGTVTLRHSASRPNCQQSPREAAFRALYRAPAGRKLVVADYSQIELRLAAIIAGDEALLEVYRAGRDVHQDVADAIGLARGAQSKGVSFAMVYGAGVAGVAEASGLPIGRAAEVVALFLGRYAGLAAYRERAPSEALALGHIPIRPGRRVRYDPVLSKGTQAINYAVQGGAASVQMRALRRVYDALAARPELDAQLVGAIHDELILEAPAGERAMAAGEILQTEMRAALLEVFPEAAAMGADRLAETVACRSWAEKS
jgi:DNA polymerase I-like protein with 3'-5' exonuclease and polymerase domains